MPRPPRTLLEIAVTRAGYRAGSRAAMFATQWAIAVADVGELAPGENVSAAVRSYAEYWGESERNVWRHLGNYRKAFPEHDSPAPIATIIAPAFEDAVQDLHQLAARQRKTSAALTVARGLTLPVVTLG